MESVDVALMILVPVAILKFTLIFFIIKDWNSKRKNK